MTVIQITTVLGIGFMFGWVIRSILFGVEEDCANPRHHKSEQ